MPEPCTQKKIVHLPMWTMRDEKERDRAHERRWRGERVFGEEGKNIKAHQSATSDLHRWKRERDGNIFIIKNTTRIFPKLKPGAEKLRTKNKRIVLSRLENVFSEIVRRPDIHLNHQLKHEEWSEFRAEVDSSSMINSKLCDHSVSAIKRRFNFAFKGITSHKRFNPFQRYI